MHEHKGKTGIGSRPKAWTSRDCGKHSSVCETVGKREKGCSGISVRDVVIVEGFLLFCDADICKMFDACIWLETDMRTCASRRNTRRPKKNQTVQLTYNKWYEHQVWVHYQQYKSMQLANVPHVCKIDASSDVETIQAQVAAIIERIRIVNYKLKLECHMPVERRGLIPKEQQRSQKRTRLAADEQMPPSPSTVAQNTAADILVRCMKHGQWRRLGHCRSMGFVNDQMTHQCCGNKKCKDNNLVR